MTTPLPRGTDLLVIDDRGRVHAIDRATGSLSMVAALPGAAPPSTLDPVLVDDHVIEVMGEALSAAPLGDAVQPWALSMNGATIRPPVVEGNTVFWLHENRDAGAVELQAVRARDGGRLWSTTLNDQEFPGGLLVREGVLYSSTPPSARDAFTGRLLWETRFPEHGAGGPVLDPASETLFVALLDRSAGGGGVVALNARTGAARWQRPVADAISIVERLWLEREVLVPPGADRKSTRLNSSH